MFMGKIVVSIPLITWRQGRPRFSPGPRLRKPPFSMKGEDLRHGAGGPWFTLDEAIAWSAERQKLVQQLAAATPRQAQKLRGGNWETVGQWFEYWLAQPRMKGQALVEGKKQRRPLSANTVANYKQGAKRIEQLDDGLVWNAPGAAMTPAIMDGIIDRIEVKHGLAVARKVRSAVSAMYSWSIAEGRHRGQHPVKSSEQTLPQAAARIRVGEKAEILHLVRAADTIGRYEIGDAIMLGVWTAQRQNDRLAITDAEESRAGITFRQHKKHGQPIVVPPSPELKARLAGMRRRRRDWKVVYHQLIVDEKAQAPFKKDWYQKVYASVRAFAAAGEGIHHRTGARVSIEPMPSVKDFRDQDLRDTAITWLALADCTIPQIASITGHSLATIEQVLKHYLGMHPELARSAIARLVAWYEGQGEGT